MEIRDHFRYGVDIQKAHQDENGDWIVEGLASSGTEDLEGESIAPEGLDYSYFLTNGFLKWEHGKNPNNFIGEPLEARVTKDGFYIKGRLYSHAPLALEAVQAIEALEKSKATRRVGFSIEGSVRQRDPKNPKKILKAVLRNVALTMNPVNDTTWATLCKSLSGADALEVDLEKTLGTGTGGEAYGEHSDGSALRPESLEKKKRLKNAVLQYIQTLVKQWNNSGESGDLGAVPEILKGLLPPQEARELTSYIQVRQSKLGALAGKIAGGELSMEDLAKALDDSLDALLKSTEEEFDEEDYDSADEETEEFDDVDEDEEEEEETEKSFFDEFVESDDTIEKALEVSDFLEALVGSIGVSMDGFSNTLTKSLTKQDKVNTALAQSLQASGELLKSMGEKLEAQDELIKSLQEAVEQFSNQPIGRRAVTNAREYQTIAKSLDGTNSNNTLSKSQVIDLLVKGVEKGEIDPLQVTKYELTGQLSADVAQRLGI